MKSVLRILFIGLAPLALAGCPPVDTKPPVLAGSGMDMFGPVRLRVHPLTRITTDNAPEGSKVMEVRIELSDQWKDVGKGVGVMSFTLKKSELLTSTVLDQWEVPIDTPQTNGPRWDSITRTYVFYRPLPAAAEGKNLVITATLTKPNGQTLSGELAVK